MYQPDEDSFLIEKYIRAFLGKSLGKKLKVLDMGSGSGILAEAALEKNMDVTAVDIDEDAVNYLKGRGIKAIKSDLFEKVKGKFDIITFNPPYLPDSKYKDISLDAGKKGYEIIERFLRDAGNFLSDDGFILFLYSSFSKPRKIKQIIRKNGFEETILKIKKVAFERLYLVRCFRP